MTRVTQRYLFQTREPRTLRATLEPSLLLRAGKILIYVNSD